MREGQGCIGRGLVRKGVRAVSGCSAALLLQMESSYKLTRFFLNLFAQPCCIFFVYVRGHDGHQQVAGTLAGVVRTKLLP